VNKRIYVLDTNIFLHDPLCFRNFEEHVVVIPTTVLRELDSKKTADGALGSNSRLVARELDKLAKEGSLAVGVRVNEMGGVLYVYGSDCEGSSSDEEILSVCKRLGEEVNGYEVCLVTKDVYLRIHAAYHHILAEDYSNDKYSEKRYTGHKDVIVPEYVLEEIYNKKEIVIEELEEEAPNLCVTLISEMNTKQKALAMHISKGRLRLLPKSKVKALTLTALNAEQCFALTMLLDANIHLITISGATGSGKTILAMAAALEQVEKGFYTQLLMARSEVPMGKSQGFLSGNIKEKTDPWLTGMYGCLDQLVGCKDSGGKDTGGYHATDFYMQKGMIRAEPLAYIRGVTWMNSILVVDEAQNTSAKELKTVLTRAGSDLKRTHPTKIILLGDTDQIDNPYLDDTSNGLCKIIENFKGWQHYGHLHLNHTVRSNLALEAGKRL
jgi:PhoH-like ATPase